MTTVKCAQCKTPFEARTADVNRGWGKFCSKRCKARKKERRTGQHAAYKHRQYGSRDAGSDGVGGRLFFANFSNEENTDI